MLPFVLASKTQFVHNSDSQDSNIYTEKMRKRILCFILIALLLGGFFAHDSLVSTFFSWYFQGYCRTCLGGDLSYESLHRDAGSLIIEKPTFATNKGLKDGGHHFQAERAKIDVNISWFERKIAFAISLTKPRIEIGKGAEELKGLFQVPQKEFHLFKVHSQFSVPEGTLVVHNFNGDQHHPIAPLFFSVDFACNEKKEGCVALWFDKPAKGSEAERLEIAFSEKVPFIPQVSLHANDIDCSLFAFALKNIWPDWAACDILQGQVKGDAILTLPSNAPPYAEGMFFVQDLCFDHSLYELKCHIPELTISLTSKNNHDGITQTKGSIDITKQASLHFLKKGNPFWEIDALGGTLVFQTGDTATLNLDALCSHSGNHHKLYVNGHARFDKEEQSSMSMEVSLKRDTLTAVSDVNQDSIVHFAAHQLGQHRNFAEVQLINFGKETFDFFQNILGHISPQCRQVHVYDGIIDAKMSGYLQGLKIGEVKIENISAHHLDLEIDPWNLTLGVAEASGILSFDFSVKDPVQTIDADLKIAEGRLSLAGLDQTKWQFADINTDLVVRKGVIQKSLIKGEAGGLTGEAQLDASSSDEVIRCNFGGKAVNLINVLPGNIRKGIEKKFSNDDLKILAGVTRLPNGISVKGKVFLTDTGIQGGELDFGFVIENFSEFDIKDGWFEGNNLRLEKYVSPFVFQQDQMQLSGFGDFHGTFDEKSVKVHYDARDLVLENSDFVIDVKRISNRSEQTERHHIATHVVDLETMRGFGKFPICNGTYFEKNSGLLFTDVNAQVSLEEGMAHLRNVETFCNGIFFAGEIDLDWSMPGTGIFEIDIRSHEMNGKVSQVQDLFSHFNKTLFFLKLPIEGNIAFRNKGGHLHFDFQPDDYKLQTTFYGMLTDGLLPSQSGDVLLQELNMNIEYDHVASNLEFSDIQGTLLVGKPGHVEEYAVAGEHIRFTDYVHNEAEFDLWVGDKKRDFIRLAGKTRSLAVAGNDGYIDFILDRTLSHFGDVHPSSFQLTLKDWSQVELFRLELDFHLKTLLHDLQRFSRTGLFFLSRSFLKELNELKAAEGNFKVDLHYQGDKGLFTYSTVGTDVAVGSHHFNKFLLNGKKKESTWIIDQLQFDEISLAADILKEGNVWNVNFLGARFGKSLLLGLEGRYSDDESILDAKVNLFELDLAYLEEWPSLKCLIDEFHPSGQLRATGMAHLEFDKTLPRGMHLDVQMNGALRSGKFKGLLLQDFENASLHYVSNKGFTLKAVNTALKSAKDNSIQASLVLQNAIYDCVNNEFFVDGLFFHVPAKNLGWLAENLQQCFPGQVSQSLVDIIRNIKKQDDVKGSLKIDISKPHCALRLTLDDGVYQFMNREHDVSSFVLEYDPFELKICSQYRHQKNQFWLTVRSPVPSLNMGELVLSERPLETYAGKGTFPLTVYWQSDPSNGLGIQKIEGSLCGLNLDLIRDPNKTLTIDQMFLVGQVDLNMSKARELLTEELAAKCLGWDLGQGYCLKGQWTIQKNDQPLTESIAFQGELLGHDFEFLGYQFYNLFAQVDYKTGVLQANHISISDPCGRIQANEMRLKSQSDGQWNLFIPSLAMNDFRPSLLRTKGTSPPRSSKALVIRQFDIRDFCGNLGDRNSFMGKGRLLFANPPKKNLQHTIFAIPAEILTRLGLDLGVLNPVRGVIFYHIKDGKMVFTRFKDVYSKGRLSKFYLANTGFESNVDFDGNLDVQVRMKQYNIFFKLAELFTVTVQGTLKKPTYSLQKQPRPERLSAIKS